MTHDLKAVSKQYLHVKKVAAQIWKFSPCNSYRVASCMSPKTTADYFERRFRHSLSWQGEIRWREVSKLQPLCCGVILRIVKWTLHVIKQGVTTLRCVHTKSRSCVDLPWIFVGEKQENCLTIWHLSSSCELKRQLKLIICSIPAVP